MVPRIPQRLYSYPPKVTSFVLGKQKARGQVRTLSLDQRQLYLRGFLVKEGAEAKDRDFVVTYIVMAEAAD